MDVFVRKAGLTGVRIKGRLTRHESEVLRDALVSVRQLLEERKSTAPQDDLATLTGMTMGHSTAPDNDALRRLLPEFHRSEDATVDREEIEGVGAADLNASLRMLHEPAIVDAKLTAIEGVLRTLPRKGGTVSLTEKDAEWWMRAVNDVRLILGVALGDAVTRDDIVHDDGSLAEDATAEDIPRFVFFHWLGVLQESICEALL